MALRDEINPKVNKINELDQWLKKQPNRKEWLSIMSDESYSSQAICTLLKKHGFECDWNVVYRYRIKHAAK